MAACNIFAHSEVVKKFITISGDRKVELIFMNINGTALDLARLRREYLLTWISMPEYSTCVFKYWTQINELNIIIELLEPYYPNKCPKSHKLFST